MTAIGQATVATTPDACPSRDVLDACLIEFRKQVLPTFQNCAQPGEVCPGPRALSFVTRNALAPRYFLDPSAVCAGTLYRLVLLP